MDIAKVVLYPWACEGTGMMVQSKSHASNSVHTPIQHCYGHDGSIVSIYSITKLYMYKPCRNSSLLWLVPNPQESTDWVTLGFQPQHYQRTNNHVKPTGLMVHSKIQIIVNQHGIQVLLGRYYRHGCFTTSLEFLYSITKLPCSRKS